MQAKRYYWLKLHEHFFDRAVIRYLRKLPEGDTIVLIYLELLCISLGTGGYVYTDGLYKSMEEDIALMLGEEVMKVRLALTALEAAKLIRGGIHGVVLPLLFSHPDCHCRLRNCTGSA